MDELFQRLTQLETEVRSIRTDVEALRQILSEIQDQLQPSRESKHSLHPELSNFEDADKELSVVEIRSKTKSEEMDFLREKFMDQNKAIIEDTTSLPANNVQDIKSLPSSAYKTSCVLKLTNHLDFRMAVSDFFSVDGTKLNGPTSIKANSAELLTGGTNKRWFAFTCYFIIHPSLRLMISAGNSTSGDALLTAELVPHNFPPDRVFREQKLKEKIAKAEGSGSGKRVNQNGFWSFETYDTYDEVVVRAQFAIRGSQAAFLVDILDMKMKSVSAACSISQEKISRIFNRDIFSFPAIGVGEKALLGNSYKIVCWIRLVNALTVPIHLREKFYCKHNHDNFSYRDIPPFEKREFIAADHEKVEGMIAFKINTTDLNAVLTYKAEGGDNAFAAAFLHSPVYTNSGRFEGFMDGKRWKNKYSSKFAQASEGEQMVQIRNIRMLVSMTEGVHCVLNVKFCAV